MKRPFPGLFLTLAALAATWARGAEIPINVGVGPELVQVPERLQDTQPQPIYGLRLSIAAIIDHEALERNKSQIPAHYRSALDHVSDVRISYLLVPESLLFAPPSHAGGMQLYGVTWRPFAVGVPIVMGPVRLMADVGLVGTYAYVDTGDYRPPSDPSVSHITNFLRPGADARVELEVALSKSVLVAVGGTSAYYIPQELGASVGTVGKHLDQSLWRIEQAYLVLNYRFLEHVNL